MGPAGLAAPGIANEDRRDEWRHFRDRSARSLAIMDSRLLEYYNRELQFMRETGAEFAHQYPRVAARLGLDGLECADPYVERLLEGFAFLAARIQLKLDARHPEFTQQL